MTGKGWKWVELAGKDWKLFENCCKWLNIAGSDWKSPETARKARKWYKWLKMA